jgi:hypothetical protein
VTHSRSVVIAEMISLVAAVIVVEWLAARLTRTSGLGAILVYAAIRLMVRLALRFRSSVSRP